MEANQMKEALHRLAELQPGLVFDVIVGQMAAKRRDTDKKDSTPSQPINYSEITMKRSGKGYIIEGHLYEGDRHDKEKGRIYLKCHKVKSGCKARARITGNEAVVLQKNHNHGLPNIIEMRFWNKAREEATKEQHKRKPLSKVYHIAKEAFLAEAKDKEERSLWETNIPSFKSVESGMRQKKAQVFTAPLNISMLDMTFNALRDKILGPPVNDTNGDVRADTQLRTSVVETNPQVNLTSSTMENQGQGPSQGPSFVQSRHNHMQMTSVSQHNIIPPDNGYHGNMQINQNIQGNIHIDQSMQGNMQIDHQDIQGNMQIDHQSVPGNMQIDSSGQSNMQISNSSQGSIQMSNETQIGENTAAVQTLLNL